MASGRAHLQPNPLLSRPTKEPSCHDTKASPSTGHRKALRSCDIVTNLNNDLTDSSSSIDPSSVDLKSLSLSESKHSRNRRYANQAPRVCQGPHTVVNSKPSSSKKYDSRYLSSSSSQARGSPSINYHGNHLGPRKDNDSRYFKGSSWFPSPSDRRTSESNTVFSPSFPSLKSEKHSKRSKPQSRSRLQSQSSGRGTPSDGLGSKKALNPLQWPENAPVVSLSSSESCEIREGHTAEISTSAPQEEMETRNLHEIGRAPLSSVQVDDTMIEDISTPNLSLSNSTTSVTTMEEFELSDGDQENAFDTDEADLPIMREVDALLGSRQIANVRTRPHGRHQADASQSNIRVDDTTKESSGKTGKRSRRDMDPSMPDGEEEDDDDDDDDGTQKRTSAKKYKNQDQEKPYACPFYKFNPTKYCSNNTTSSQYRSCAGPGFCSISRLKQHLYRKHKAPKQCQNCWRIMPESQAMMGHCNNEVRCERREPQPEGISKDKMNSIKNRHGASWEAIFEIIFPNASISSPYYDESQELPNFEEYSNQMLLTRVEAHLHEMIRMEPIGENLRNTLLGIMQESLRRGQFDVSQDYRRLQESAPLLNRDSAQNMPHAVSGRRQQQQETNPCPPTIEDSSTHMENDASTRTINWQQFDIDTSTSTAPRPHDDGLGKARTDRMVVTNCTDCSCECHNTRSLRGGFQEHTHCFQCAINHTGEYGDINFEEYVNSP